MIQKMKSLQYRKVIRPLFYRCLAILLLAAQISFAANELEGLNAKAAAGDANAQFELGKIYEIGQKTERNVEEAFKWYLKAAQQGHAESQFKVGKCFFHGYGTDLDQNVGVQWFQVAAEKDHSQAIFQLARCY